MRNQELLEIRIAFIRRIVDRCDDTGKTKMQKISYFLQESVGVDLMYPFRMHYFGPYSEDLDSALSLTASIGLIGIEPDSQGFGFHLNLSNGQSEWSQEYDIATHPEIAQIDKAIDVLGKLEIYELELYATIHYIGGPKTARSKEQTLETVKRLKPKFSDVQIGNAYDDLKKAHLI